MAISKMRWALNFDFCHILERENCQVEYDLFYRISSPSPPIEIYDAVYKVL